MAAGQLWLFPPPKPLVERLGEAFFRQLPTGPGVYLMCGPTEGVLYVGRARNLRRRLASYRVANPERLPRRLIRLLARVTRIEWDACPDEATARHREALLICALTPRYNVAGKVFPRLEGPPNRALRSGSAPLPSNSASPSGVGQPSDASSPQAGTRRPSEPRV